MTKRHFHGTGDEKAVVISLALSLGMVIMSIVGVWAWSSLGPIVASIFFTVTGDAP